MPEKRKEKPKFIKIIYFFVASLWSKVKVLLVSYRKQNKKKTHTPTLVTK